MTPNEQTDRIDRIENRVDHMEREVLQKIFDKLESLTIIVTKQTCPAPGACVGLSSKLQDAIIAHNATMLRVERLELELIKLNQQKAWLLGVWSAIAFFAGILGSVGTLFIAKLGK